MHLKNLSIQIYIYISDKVYKSNVQTWKNQHSVQMCIICLHIALEAIMAYIQMTVWLNEIGINWHQ